VACIRGESPQRGTSVAEGRHILQVLAAMSASANQGGMWQAVDDMEGAP
jgi:hypothetical protein